jgi:hypothetical protein
VEANIAVGQVTSTSPLEIRFYGDTGDTAVTALAHYTPATNDKVILVKVGPQWFIVGEF